ncbi:unnamed protein product [Linum trigynum]|uniref:Uncharacterized protein n=1 Tax=Linum trigynum TaxID=586398 RepID=A0AAV2G269_9ROSI
MDGLIPLVCRAFNKIKTRRHYECLSSGAAESYNAADHVPSLYTNIPPRSGFQNGRDCRRSMSTAGDFASERQNLSAIVSRSVVPGGKQQEMVRFRRHRRLFSCVSLVQE